MKIIKTKEELLVLSRHERQHHYLAESLSTTHPIRDTHEPLIDIQTVADQSQVKIITLSVAPRDVPILYLRQSVAMRLLQVARSLLTESADSITLKVTDAFRPLTLQRRYFQEIQKEISIREGLSGQALWDRVTQFIADPTLCPPHSTGGAVDCTLVNLLTGQELDMGTKIDAITDEAQTWHTHISPIAQDNRRKLYRAMTACDFINVPTEWWHYSYGDQYWAMVRDKKFALYDCLESLPVD